MAINKVILIGHLGSNPEVRTFPDGGQVANVSLATTDKWTDKQTGQKKEATEWHKLVFNDRLAEIAGQYLRKGSQIYVEGSIRTRKWNDATTGQDRYATEIRVQQMQMLGGRSDNVATQNQQNMGNNGASYSNTSNNAQPPMQAPTAPTGGGFEDIDDDIPF